MLNAVPCSRITPDPRASLAPPLTDDFPRASMPGPPARARMAVPFERNGEGGPSRDR